MLLKKLSIALIAVAFSISGCASSLYEAQVLHNKAANIKNLTNKAKGAILRQIPDDIIYEYLQKNYPRDIEEFQEYSLQFRNANGYAVILMCDKKKTKALIEDISCTGAVEGGELFKEDIACGFSLDVETECSK
jgi:hypothetical protein